MYEKDSGHRMEKQAFPSLPGSFSIRFADAITRCVIGLPHC